MGQSSLPATSVGASKFSSRGIIEEGRKGEKRGVSKAFLATPLKEKKKREKILLARFVFEAGLFVLYFWRPTSRGGNKIPTERIRRERLVSLDSSNFLLFLPSFRFETPPKTTKSKFLCSRSTVFCLLALIGELCLRFDLIYIASRWRDQFFEL